MANNQPSKTELYRRLNTESNDFAKDKTWEQIVCLDSMWNFQSFRNHHERDFAKELIQKALNQCSGDTTVFPSEIWDLFRTDANRCVEGLYQLLRHAKDDRRKGPTDNNTTGQPHDLLPPCYLTLRRVENRSFSVWLDEFAPVTTHRIDHRNPTRRIPASALRFSYLKDFLRQKVGFEPSGQIIRFWGVNGQENQDGLQRAITDDVTIANIVESAVRTSPHRPAIPFLTLEFEIFNRRQPAATRPQPTTGSRPYRYHMSMSYTIERWY